MSRFKKMRKIDLFVERDAYVDKQRIVNDRTYIDGLTYATEKKINEIVEYCNKLPK